MELHERIAQLEDQVRRAGEQAYRNGQKLTDCPHAAHTGEAAIWRRAFANAQFGAQMNMRGTT